MENLRRPYLCGFRDGIFGVIYFEKILFDRLIITMYIKVVTNDFEHLLAVKCKSLLAGGYMESMGGFSVTTASQLGAS